MAEIQLLPVHSAGPGVFTCTSKIDERQILTALREHEPRLLTDRPGLLIRPSTATAHPSRRTTASQSIRQLAESGNDTLEGQPNLEQHGGRTVEGVRQHSLAAPPPSDASAPPANPSPGPSPTYDH